MALFSGLFGRKKKPARVTDTAITRKSRDASRLLSYQAANLQMVGARERQEDSFAVLNAMDVTEIIQNGLFAIMADGMGGMQDGKLVSEAAVGEFIAAFHNLERNGDIPKQLSGAYYDINNRLFERFGGSGGTTAITALFYSSRLYWASVGDSAIYLKRNGGLFQLNKEHAHINELLLDQLYKETIDADAAMADEDGERLSEFLGIDRLGEVDFNRKPLRLRTGDVIFICSDGISDSLSEEEISAALGLSPPDACVRLNADVIRKGNPRQDNYTGLIIACKD